MTTRQENLETLEQMIDLHTLHGVLTMLSEVCAEKEQHLLSNWQDAQTAKVWRKAELSLDRLAINLSI